MLFLYLENILHIGYAVNPKASPFDIEHVRGIPAIVKKAVK